MANNKNKKQNIKKHKKQVTQKNNKTNKTNGAKKKTVTKSTNIKKVTTKKTTKKQTTVNTKNVVPKKVEIKEVIKPIVEEKEIIKNTPDIIETKHTNNISTEVKTAKPKVNKYQKMYQNNKNNIKKIQNTQRIKKIEDTTNATTNQEPKSQPENKIKYVNIIDYIKIKFKKKTTKVIDPKLAKQLDKEQKKQAYKISLQLKQQKQEETTKEKINKKPLKDYSKSNIFVRTCINIYRNLHIIFSTIIMITFIILLLGLILPKAYTLKTILFYSSLLLFLILVAISQNKYLSGKIFTTILTTGMIVAIVNLQYTYDFVNIINKNNYSHKTYYVVAFDNNINRSINSINNKKVGLINKNNIKISRVLNTKISNVTYLTYEDDETLYNDFYSQKFRAVIVNDSQLEYLQSNPRNNKKLKILHKFKAVTKK